MQSHEKGKYYTHIFPKKWIGLGNKNFEKLSDDSKAIIKIQTPKVII